MRSKREKGEQSPAFVYLKLYRPNPLNYLKITLFTQTRGLQADKPAGKDSGIFPCLLSKLFTIMLRASFPYFADFCIVQIT